MGIKLLTAHLDKSPQLAHTQEVQWKAPAPANSSHLKDCKGANVLVWDVLGFATHDLFFIRKHSSRFLFDFSVLYRTCCDKLTVLRKCGFEVVAFIDGYFCVDKLAELQSRKKESSAKYKRMFRVLSQLHGAQRANDEQLFSNLMGDYPWIFSNGYANFLEQALVANGCTVYRGSGEHDIDKDMAEFAIRNKERVYGIISNDSDMFGFLNMPKHCRIIRTIKWSVTTSAQTESVNETATSADYHKIIEATVKFTYFYASEVWANVGLRSAQQVLQCISALGNDFVNAHSMRRVLKRCGIKHKPSESSFLGLVAGAIASENVKTPFEVDELLTSFYLTSLPQDTEEERYQQHQNTTWMGLRKDGIFAGTLFLHDVYARGFTVHDKLAPLRKQIIRQVVNDESIIECVASFDTQRGVDWVQQIVVLREEGGDEGFDGLLELMKPCPGSSTADLHRVFERTMAIMEKYGLIDQVQHNALTLQFEVNSGTFRDTHAAQFWSGFWSECRSFKRKGLPRVEDLTAQSLFWEVARLICLNPQLIMPNIWELFDGPMFHYLMREQVDGDKKRWVKTLLRMLRSKKKRKPLSKKTFKKTHKHKH